MSQEKLEPSIERPFYAMSSGPLFRPAERRASVSGSRLRKVFQSLAPKANETSTRRQSSLPPPSAERLRASLSEHAFECEGDLNDAKEKGLTVLYLAYGSNLCYETFQGRRGIKPISQMNVVVPELVMTFDLPGVAYSEPCFANSARRDPNKSSQSTKSEYNKDKWKKGMVGVVYEVTPSDYAHIIATEGGGASYEDILVSCHPLPSNIDDVPEVPTTASFKAHTLFAPALPSSKHEQPDSLGGRFQRPDPSYAQASARYLKLITDGADEHNIPQEYKTYLHNLQPYTITTQKQQLGQFIFLMLWSPFLLLMFAMGRMLQDENGRVPKWYAEFTQGLFTSMWRSYDGLFKPLFGDGERTVQDKDEDLEKQGGSR